MPQNSFKSRWHSRCSSGSMCAWMPDCDVKCQVLWGARKLKRHYSNASPFAISAKNIPPSFMSPCVQIDECWHDAQMNSECSEREKNSLTSIAMNQVTNFALSWRPWKRSLQIWGYKGYRHYVSSPSVPTNELFWVRVQDIQTQQEQASPFSSLVWV